AHLVDRCNHLNRLVTLLLAIIVR
ncbi:hypothetical protein D030_1814B, partial [Vibrio parahaemolyticus AQ3810]